MHRREVGFTYHRILFPRKLEEKRKKRKKRKVPFFRFRFRYRKFIYRKALFSPFRSEGKGVEEAREREREGENRA